MDHIRVGKAFKHFVYPSKVEGFVPFKDALREVIPVKIKQITARMKKLEVERKKITSRVWQSKDQWFLEMYADARFEEPKVLKKWLRYWLDLWDQINETKKVPPAQHEFDLERAREYPIENLYQGQLRKVGDRLTGKCPFHANGQERTASFFIFSDNRWRCFACGEFGDVLDFLQKTKGYSFQEALKELA